jgi:hypothetical protein
MPHRVARHPTANVLTTDERDVVAKFLDEKIDQATPVLVFFGRHIGENMGAGGIIVP